MYSFLRSISKVFFMIVYRLRITGTENIVTKGPVIFAANHTSMLDPFMMGFSIKRNIRFLGKVELTKIFFVSYIIKLIEVIPVDRTKNDITALKTSINALKEGSAIGIFPEGTRVKDGDNSENKAGIGLIAVKSNAVIQPITIKSTYKLFSRVDVTIHPPYIPHKVEKYTSKDYEKISNDVMEIIKEK